MTFENRSGTAKPAAAERHSVHNLAVYSGRDKIGIVELNSAGGYFAFNRQHQFLGTYLTALEAADVICRSGEFEK
jgi:hypothetical protein